MTLSEDLAWRGFINQTTLPDLTLIDSDPIKFFWGVDPSADSMTIGNLASAMLVKHFMNAGHQATLLVGGATALIGDPDGKKNERELKTKEAILQNTESIIAQYRRIFDQQSFWLVNNADWFQNINFIEFLMTAGKHVPMAQMLNRKFVQDRLETTGISFAEFSYSLIQAFDFLHLNREFGVTMQLCGSDQWGNSTAGVSLIRRMDGKEAHVFTTPLIVNKATGVKFGKSETGAIWLDEKKTSVFAFHQFWLTVPDSTVLEHLKIFTMLTRQEIENLQLKMETASGMLYVKKMLAFEVTKIVHGEQRAVEVAEATAMLFGNQDVTQISESALRILELELKTIADIGLLSTLMVSGGLASSLSNARRLMQQNGVSVSGKKVLEDVKITTLSLIRRGKNQFVLVKPAE